jgi:hypothetical protein
MRRDPCGLTRERLIELVQGIVDVQGTDEEISEWAEEINASTGHPDILDLIYYGDQSLTAEEIDDAALAHDRKSIPLPPPESE